MRQNKFITVEGIEGAGKSTAMTFIKEYFLKSALDCVETREPGGTEIAEEIRQVLLFPASSEKLLAHTELLLMFASRAQLINTKIKPALLANQWVISDRYVDASYAYQGGGRGIEENYIAMLDKMIVGDCYPGLTLLLDVPVALGLQRTKNRQGKPDRIEQEATDFFTRVRTVYLTRAQADPQRFKLINTEADITEVRDHIHHILQAYIAGQ